MVPGGPDRVTGRNAQGTAGRGTCEGVTSGVASETIRCTTDDLDPTDPPAPRRDGRHRRLCGHARPGRWARARSERAHSRRPSEQALGRLRRPVPTDDAGLAAGAPGTAFGLAFEPLRARSGRLTGRGGRAPRQGPVRVPLPVPRRRGQHGQRLGDLEHEWRVRHLLRGGLGRQPRRPRLPVLPAAPVEPGGRWRREGAGPVPPRQSHHHGSLLQRSQAVLRPCRRLDPGDPPRRAGPVGLHRAADRDRRRRDDRPGLGRQLG